MKKCPFCKEEIHEDAVKCGHCQSWLLPNQPSAEKNEDSAKKPGPDQTQYILDNGLIRFGKFVVGALAFFIAIGAFLWGFNIKEASDEAKDAVGAARIARDSIKYYEKLVEQNENEAHLFEDHIRKLVDSIRLLRDSAQKGNADIQNYRAGVLRGAPTGKGIESNDAPISGPAFTAPQIARLYDFPTNLTGKGQTIAFIELGGGYQEKDLKTYFKTLGTRYPDIKWFSVAGGKNSPTNANSADGDVVLNIEVAGSVAPDARILVYFAPNTNQGFLAAINRAIADNPSVISISWGSTESLWTKQAMTAFNAVFQKAALQNITVCVASGDSGSGDGATDGKVHVDFPASSPWVLACGGTTIKVKDSKIISETVWNSGSSSGAGGGISDIFPLPYYQTGANVPLSLNGNTKGRGIPDVAGVADPGSGYKILVDGQQMVVGGSAAFAPLMAGFTALINQGVGKNIGFFNKILYTNSRVHSIGFHDITAGNNITTTTHLGYKAGPGWDACSGWGRPDGAKLIEELKKVYN